MAKNRYTVWFLAVLAAAALVNGIFVYLLGSSREYIDADGRILSREQMREAEKILSDCDYSEYGEKLGAVMAECSSLYEYLRVMQGTENGTRKLKGVDRNNYSEEQVRQILDRYNYTEPEVTARLNMLEYCVQRFRYAMSYSDYALQVVSSAALMSDVSIFSDSAVRRILKTARDFYGHENIRVSAVPDMGVRRLFGDSLTDVIAIGMAIVCALLYSRRCHAGAAETMPRNKNMSFALCFLAGLFLLYGSGTFVSDAVFRLGDPSRAVQSVTDYYTSPYMISVGALILFRIAMKVLACMILYELLLGLLLCHKKWIAVLIGGLAVCAEWLLNASGMDISLYSAFHAERLIMGYSSIPVLGEVVDTGWVLAAFLLCLFAAAYIFAGKNISSELLLEKERREKIYFDEVNNRYTETRMIRHDINNHLTAIAMLMDEGNMEEARRYLGMVSAQMDEVRQPVKTGSSVLDAVLFGKMRDADGKGISIELDFTANFAQSEISDYDLCSVFGNLLDNAIEACGKLPDEERKVCLRVKKQADMICVYCENRYLEIREENGGFSTLKPDKKAHGLGLKRIQRIAEKYNGTMDVRAEDGVFSISVLFVP